MPNVSIIIRSKNEEEWIGHCLKTVNTQTYKDFEVILADDNSTDATNEIAKRHGVKKIIEIKDYLPGYAINEGIKKSSGRYIISLSAHCVPKGENWLKSLLSGFEDGKVAGVYGRQLPVSFSADTDKRDLLVTFGVERRVQRKDYFFNNANSILRRDIWEKVPFDNKITNLEDRIWAKAVIEMGYTIVYEPEAAVYHYHGIHQTQKKERLQKTVCVLEQVEKEEITNSIPKIMHPENIHVSAICPVLGDDFLLDGKVDLLSGLIDELEAARYVNSIFVISESQKARRIASNRKVRYIERPDDLYPPEKNLEDILTFALSRIEKEHYIYPNALIYANCLFAKRPEGYFDELIRDLQYKGLHTVFGGYKHYSNYWLDDGSGNFIAAGEAFKPRAIRHPLYEALYGLGIAISAAQMRKGHMIGKRVGIVPITDPSYRYKVEKK